jgi:hypothetical protein
MVRGPFVLRTASGFDDGPTHRNARATRRFDQFSELERLGMQN